MPIELGVCQRVSWSSARGAVLDLPLGKNQIPTLDAIPTVLVTKNATFPFHSEMLDCISEGAGFILADHIVDKTSDAVCAATSC